MGILDKAKDLANNEQTTDTVLDKAAQAANAKFGEQNADKIQQARDAADKKLGTE